MIPFRIVNMLEMAVSMMILNMLESQMVTFQEISHDGLTEEEKLMFDAIESCISAAE